MASTSTSSTNIDNSKNNSTADKKMATKSVIPNRYMSTVGVGGLKNTNKSGVQLKVKPNVGKADVKASQKMTLPVKVQTTVTDEDRMDTLYNIYLQGQLLVGYMQEKSDYIAGLQADESSIAIIDEYLSSEKDLLELLANEKVNQSLDDLRKLEELNATLDILHPFVTHKHTVAVVDEMEASLARVLDFIPVNIPVEGPLDFSELKTSAESLQQKLHSDTVFSLSLDVDTMTAEVKDSISTTQGLLAKKCEISTELAAVTSLKICEMYKHDMGKEEKTPKKAPSTALPDFPTDSHFHSTPYPTL